MSLRAPLLSSDRRPDCDDNEVPLWQVFKDELVAIIALAGPACVQLGSQQVIDNSKPSNCILVRPIDGARTDAPIPNTSSPFNEGLGS